MPPDPMPYLTHIEMPEGRDRYRCVCGTFFRTRNGHTDKKFCPECTETASAVIKDHKRVHAQTKAADAIVATLGKVTQKKGRDSTTLSTNEALQEVGRTLQRIYKTETPDQAFGKVVSDVTVEVLGINPDKPGTGAKPHLKLQVANMLMQLMRDVETLTAAKTLDLSHLEEEDLFLLLKPVAMEMLKSNTDFLVECLKAANMQVITDNGDLLGAGDVLEIDNASDQEDGRGLPGGTEPEGGQRVDGSEAGWPEDVSTDGPAGTDLPGNSA